MEERAWTLFTDEQVALKKKEKEASEKWNNPWKKSETDKIVWEKFQILDQSKTSTSVSSILSQSPSQVTVVQADGDSLSRASQILEMGNKTKIAKCPLRTKQTGFILKSTQNTCIRSEKLLQKKRIGSETSLAKGEKDSMTFSPTKDLCKQYADKDCLHIQKEISPATPTED